MESPHVESIVIDDMASPAAMRAFAGSLVAGTAIWAVALVVILY